MRKNNNIHTIDLEKMMSEKDELISNLNEELEVRPSLETYQQATDQVQKLTHKVKIEFLLTNYLPKIARPRHTGE